VDGAAVSDPVTIGASQLFEFLGGEGLKVVLISVHPLHTFNRTISRHLEVTGETVSAATISLVDLVTDGGAALRYLHQGMRACGAPASLGVLPGYCLFRKGEMIAWDAGLPAFGDVEAILRGAALGVAVSGLTHDLGAIGKALHAAADSAAGARVAARFHHVASQPSEGPRERPRETAAFSEDVYWAYHMLGVLPTATDREVHDAWRRRRMEHHPDRASHDRAEFDRLSRLSADINRARDVIVAYRSGGASRVA
jgi:hypothetical protein